ncbi:hypothetical protein Tco_1100516, partial [Tanacetum coccineum]
PSKKDQSKKRKLVKESSEAPSLAKRPKAGKVIKKRKPKSSLQLIDELVDEGVPDKEPVYGDEEADTQRAIEKSLKEVHEAHRGPLPPVVIREPDSRKFQPLPDVQGKGKEKVSYEQVACRIPYITSLHITTRNRTRKEIVGRFLERETRERLES